MDCSRVLRFTTEDSLTLCLCTRMYQRHSVNTAVWRQRSTPCRSASSETQCTLDSGAKLWAYLDDLYIWIRLHLALGATRTINVELQPQQDADLDSLLRQPRSTYFCEQSQTHVEVPESPSPHCGWQRRQPVGARWTGPPSCANSSCGIQHAYSQRPAHHVRGSCQSTRLAHDFRPGSRGYQFRHRGRGLLVTPRR